MKGFMPKKLVSEPFLHPNINARLAVWGRCVRVQRVRQKIKAVDFCLRIDISESTLRRLESGDPSVAAGTYLAALNALGLMDAVVPMPSAAWFEGSPNARVSGLGGDDDYF